VITAPTGSHCHCDETITSVAAGTTLAAKVGPLKIALAQYEDMLWNAGARRK
jgi:hypothetical protein